MLYRAIGVALAVWVVLVALNLFIVLQGVLGRVVWGISHGALSIDVLDSQDLAPKLKKNCVFVTTLPAIRYYWCQLGPDMVVPRLHSTQGVGRVYKVPLWLLSVPPAMLYWYRDRARLRRLRNTEGVCKYCGYDLRGTPVARCSECGRAIPESPRTPYAPLK